MKLNDSGHAEIGSALSPQTSLTVRVDLLRIYVNTIKPVVNFDRTIARGKQLKNPYSGRKEALIVYDGHTGQKGVLLVQLAIENDNRWIHALATKTVSLST